MIVLPRTTVEQRAPLYEDVESFVQVGFLSHSVLVGGKRIALRTLCPGDLFLFRARVFKGADVDWQTWMLAAAIWMVDGFSLLEEQNSAWHLHGILTKIPVKARDLLFSLLAGLFARQSRAFEAIEPWCCEPQSRYKWRALKGSPSGIGLGLPGTERLGINAFQQMWRAYNELEDQRHLDETMWEGFKFTASAMAPKGVQKVYQQDKTRRHSEEERRQVLLDRFYYTVKGVISDEKADAIGLGATPVLMAASKDPEQLSDEMYRWVTGQEDSHDQIVSAYKRRIVERYAAEKVIREERRLAFMQKQQELEESEMPTRMIAMTAEQLEEHLRDRKPGVRHIVEGDVRGLQDRVFGKFLATSPDAGLLQQTEDGKVIDPTGTTIGALQDQVASRQVPFHVDKG